MERGTKNIILPDAINCGIVKGFTQVPNQLIRDPKITCKAKVLISILLSNRDGWKSCFNTIKTMLKEGDSSLRSGLKELEEHGYLMRIKYRNRITKAWVGSFWAYTDTPWQFDFTEHVNLLESSGMEIENPCYRNPRVGFPQEGFKHLYIYKNTNNKNIFVRSQGSYREEPKENKTLFQEEELPKMSEYPITLGMFEAFWKAYPKKASKGGALTAWKKICGLKPKERPSWRQIKLAIRRQKDSERWQDPQYIPMPSTWLNQSRWLDDPKHMTSFTDKSKPTCPMGWNYGKDFKYEVVGCQNCEDTHYDIWNRCKRLTENWNG